MFSRFTEEQRFLDFHHVSETPVINRTILKGSIFDNFLDKSLYLNWRVFKIHVDFDQPHDGPFGLSPLAKFFQIDLIMQRLH